MTSNVNIEMNTAGLERLMSSLKKAGKARVGILGGDATRSDNEGGTINNASLGMVQEMGSTSRNIPPRSFLRMPLLHRRAELAKAMQTSTFKDAFESGDKEKALKILGVAAENIVQDAFQTSGFGRWKPLKAATIKAKGSAKPLIDTAQLRRSISSEVVDGK